MSFFYLPPEQHFPSSATYPCALTSIAFVASASHVWGTFKPSFSLFITIFHSHAHENVSINELVDIGKHFKCSWEKKGNMHLFVCGIPCQSGKHITTSLASHLGSRARQTSLHFFLFLFFKQPSLFRNTNRELMRYCSFFWSYVSESESVDGKQMFFLFSLFLFKDQAAGDAHVWRIDGGVEFTNHLQNSQESADNKYCYMTKRYIASGEWVPPGV